MWGLLVSSMPAFCLVGAAPAEVRSEDASVRWDREAIVLDNDAARIVLRLDGGRLVRAEWLGKRAGADVLAGEPSADFEVDLGGRLLSSAEPGWRLDGPLCRVLSHGEIEVRITLERDGVRVTRTYLLFPAISLTRGWLEIENTGAAEATLVDPPILSLAHRASPGSLRWMTGGEMFGDSWRMREEPLSEGLREFDSYDAPPTAHAELPGDGTDARILLGERVLWPAEGWAHSAHSNEVLRHEVTAEVRAGDRLLFVLGRHGHMICDTTEWDPTIAYEDGATSLASEGFSTTQGGGGWSYGYLSDSGEYRDLVYSDAPGRYGNRWRLDPEVIEPFVAAGEMHPDPGGAAVRVFTAPRDGRVTISGTVRNAGNGGPAGRGFRLGSMAYAPWLCLAGAGPAPSTYLGFDCMAHWRAEVTREATGDATARVRLAGYRKPLAPGEVVRTPSCFSGLVGEDLDEMGQEILAWQYRAMWDYTREPWFPGVRMLGYWYKGTTWGSHGWVGGDADYESAYRKVFRTADFMREVGGDTYHRDWGWWDRAGDWNGPDFGSSGRYLRKYGMGQLIYAFLYTVDPESSVARAHPEWLADGTTLDQSLPEVVDYEAGVLDSFRRRFGSFQWRNDSFPLAPRGGDDTVLLGQQQGFMELLRRFQDKHPDCAFQGVNGGGMGLNWEYLGYASGFQFTDGQSKELANYDASYLFPPDKINNMPDIWDPARFDPATWRGLLCSNFDLTGDTFDRAQLEGLREIIDIYHYLGARGVVGRWVRVYHPLIEGDDETMYLERLSWDRTRGVIITKHRIEGAVTVYPKGLLPELSYEVSFQDDPRSLTLSGAELMAAGVRLSDAAPGELIYLNLTDHPGNRLDTTPPSRPAEVRCYAGRNMGVPGVEVAWAPATDDHWLSYYTIARDGEEIGRVAKGTFYFDHSAGADPCARYEVRAVDGSGNVGLPGVTPRSEGPRLLVRDDADADGIVLGGAWPREVDSPQAHRGTLSSATEAGASFEARFVGRAVTWHGRLGAEGGLARVSLDGGEPVEVSCYAADEIPGWPLFERRWDEAGEHLLRVEVLGQPDRRNAGTRVWLDAVSIEP